MTITLPTEVCFADKGEVFSADGSSIRKVYLSGVGVALPRGMFALYTVCTHADGKIVVDGRKQARTARGARSFCAIGPDAESRIQADILKWSKRILRELSPNRRIKLNAWGNWKGYEGTRIVYDFGTNAQAAQDWQQGGDLPKFNRNIFINKIGKGN